MSRGGALSYCGGCSLRCRLPSREKKKKKKRNGSAAARQVCWGGFLLVPAFLQTGEMAGDTASLSAVGLVGAEGWIAGYK